MSLRQTSNNASDGDLLAIPGATAAAFRQLNGQREEMIAARTAAAHARHEQRCTEHRAALMRGDLPLVQYRGAVADSAAQRDDEIADTPPSLDVELSRARVEARALEAMAGWWGAEVARAQVAQQAWAAATVDSATETIAEREMGTVYA